MVKSFLNADLAERLDPVSPQRVPEWEREETVVEVGPWWVIVSNVKRDEIFNSEGFQMTNVHPCQQHFQDSQRHELLRWKIEFCRLKLSRDAQTQHLSAAMNLLKPLVRPSRVSGAFNRLQSMLNGRHRYDGFLKCATVVDLEAVYQALLPCCDKHVHGRQE